MAPSGNTTVMSTKMLAMDWEISRVSEIPEWSPKTMEDTDALDRAIRLSLPPPYISVPQNHFQMIVLKVVRNDDESKNEIQIPINVRSQFKNLKESYAQRVGVPVISLRFFFNGRLLSDEETPRALEMEQGNIIEVFFGRRYSY